MVRSSTKRTSTQTKLTFAIAAVLVILTLGSAILSIAALADAGTPRSTSFKIASVTALNQLADPRDGSRAGDFLLIEGPVCPPSPARGVPAFPGVYSGILAAIATGALAYFIRVRLLASK